MGAPDLVLSAIFVVRRKAGYFVVVGVTHDMVDPVGERSDWVACFSSGLVMDALVAHSVFLVGNGECGTCGCEQFVECCGIGDDEWAIIAEGDIFDSKLVGSCMLISTSPSVFTDSEEEIEADVGEMAHGLFEWVR